VNRTDIEEVCIEAARLLGLVYHAVFQVIVGSERKIYLIECNCRFGGASSLSLAAGLDSFYWFFLESVDERLLHMPMLRSENKLKQVRYLEDMIVSMDDSISGTSVPFADGRSGFDEKEKVYHGSL
jgi:carbamoyl-phosphate synthase large subunit